MSRNFTTDADIRDEIGLVLDEGADGRDQYDVAGITDEIVQVVGLPSRVEQDEDGAWAYIGDSGALDTEGFWAIVERHDNSANA